MPANEPLDMFPYLIARVSGCTPNLLSSLCLKHTAAALEQAAQIEETLARLSPALADALFAVIPHLTDRGLRSWALALKRDIHNLRSSAPFSADDTSMTSRLSPEALAQLQEWMQLTEMRDYWRRRAADAYVSELGQANLALASALSDEQLRGGIAMASPEFAAALARHGHSEVRPGGRFGRSCVSYLMRATTKVSPFSTLTRIGLAQLTQETPAGEHDAETTIHVNRAVATILLQRFALHPELAPAFRYCSSQVVPPNDTSSPVLLPEYIYRNSIFGRLDRLVDGRGYSDWIDLARRIHGATYADCLAVVGTADPHALFRILLGLHLIRPVPPWPPKAHNPLPDLVRPLAESGSTLAQSVATAVGQMAVAVKNLAAGPVERRVFHISRIREGAIGTLETVGELAPQWLNDAPVVYEDARITHAVPALGLLVHQDLQRVGQWMRNYVIRCHLYDTLVTHFVRIYGPGGRCGDILQFLASFLALPESGQLITSATAADSAAVQSSNHPRTRLPAGKGATPPHAALYFQLVSATPATLLRGEYRLVVNQCTPGHIGILLRSSRAFPSHTALTAKLQDWVRTTFSQARVLQLPVYADWNTLQYQTMGSCPVLHWPGESPVGEAESPVHLRQLQLVHDPVNDVLDILGSDGTPVAPVYLGMVQKQFVAGPLGLFLTLTDPWYHGMPAGTRLTYWDPGRVAPSRVEFHPAVEEGRVVYARACWRIPTADFPLLAKGESEFAYFERLNRWRRQHQIPSEVYFRAERQSVPMDANLRKPLWLRFDCPHSIHTVKPVVTGDVTAIRLEQALPAAADCWLEGDDGQPRASEFVALVRWPESGREPID